MRIFCDTTSCILHLGCLQLDGVILAPIISLHTPREFGTLLLILARLFAIDPVAFGVFTCALGAAIYAPHQEYAWCKKNLEDREDHYTGGRLVCATPHIARWAVGDAPALI
jgi:hypothetical protein